jgi:hypothetical protein
MSNRSSKVERVFGRISLLTEQGRIIDLGTIKQDFAKWTPYDRVRAWKRLQAYLIYPEDDRNRRLFFTAITAHQLTMLARLRRKSAKGFRQIEQALKEENHTFATLGGLSRLVNAESLWSYERALPGRWKGKAFQALRARDIVTTGLIFAMLSELRHSGERKQGKAVNSAIGRLCGPGRGRNKRELWRLWSRAKTVAHLCAAMLVTAQQALHKGAALSAGDLGMVLRLATILQEWHSDVIGGDPWRLPKVTGLPKPNLVTIPLVTPASAG